MSAVLLLGTFYACSPSGNNEGSKNNNEAQAAQDVSGQASVSDDESQKDIVKVAVGSPDHTTLVTAVKAAELVDVLSNAGPFTVFAPVNAAFDALPAGTVETLMKPENKTQLQNVLQHHVYVGVLKTEQLTDGMVLGMVDGTNVKVSVKDGQTYINDAKVVGSVTASNGIVHVVDKVIVP